MTVRATAMTKPAAFWDRIAEKYSRQPIANEAAYQEKLRMTQGYMRPDMEVLELGCGTGSTALVHAPYVKHIRATDISSKMLEIAKAKAEAGNIRNVTFEQAAFDDVTAPEGGYDMVLALSLLHLLEDRDAAIAKIHGLLKPGGLFVSNTVCAADRMGYFRFIAPIGKALGLMPLFKIFSFRDLHASIADGGFDIDREYRPDEKAISTFIVAKKAG